VRCSGSSRTNVSGRLRLAVILVVGKLRVLGRLLTSGTLCSDGSGVALVHGSDFCRAWLNVYAAVAAVVADAVGGLRGVMDVVVDNGALVVIADAGAYVGDGAVVIEVVSLPVASEEAEADVAEAVIDATVEADVRTPVSAVEAVVSAAPAPVGRCPESAIVGWRNPLAGNPVVAVVAPRPVAGSPEIVGVGSGRLVVFRKRRRGLVGGDGDFLVCGSGAGLVVAVVVGVVVDGSAGGLLGIFTGLLRLIGVALAEDSAGLSGREVSHGRVRTSGVSSSIGGGIGDCSGTAAVASGEAQQGGQSGCGTGATQEARGDEMRLVVAVKVEHCS
jgi:hypothetical protein